MSEKETMVRALRACRAWHIAESKTIGTFQARMELCSLSEWLTRKALGDDLDGYEGVPFIAMGEGLSVHRVVPNEDEAWALVEEVEAELQSEAT